MCKKIPDSNNFIRYCSPGTLSEKDQRPTAASFKLKEKTKENIPEKYLSGDLKDFFNKPIYQNLLKVLQKRMVIKKNGKLAAINVGLSKKDVKKKTKIDIEFCQLKESYSGIFNYTYSDLLVAEVLASNVIELIEIKAI